MERDFKPLSLPSPKLAFHGASLKRYFGAGVGGGVVLMLEVSPFGGPAATVGRFSGTRRPDPGGITELSPAVKDPGSWHRKTPTPEGVAQLSHPLRGARYIQRSIPGSTTARLISTTPFGVEATI